MAQSSGEVSRLAGIPSSALRYHEREGLFPGMERSSGGIRVFSDVEMEMLRIVECLKMSGMPIKDIKQFLDWCQEGNSTLQQRRDMFYERLEAMEEQMQEMQKTMDTVKYKCWYYDTALKAGTEEAPKNMPVDDMPQEVQAYIGGTVEYKKV